MKFNCTKCGACCRFVGRAVANLKEEAKTGTLHPANQLLLNFPYEVTANGTCEKYDPAIGCTIYETRPLICQVNKIYHLYNIIDSSITEAAFNMANADACNKLMGILNIDEKFRIPLDKASI